jgi:uncharacterized delta-60 repeat protein
MGINYNPRIVTNGLVLALDAGNIKSYPGIGTNWTDLIGSGNNGTLTNGSYYRSTSGGSIVFDGSDDNVSIGTNGFSFGSSPGTLSAWAKTRDRTNTRTIVSYGSSVTNQARFLGVGASNFYFSGYGTSISASGISTDTWFNLVGVYDGTNASMYVNGALVAGPTDRSSWNTIVGNAGIGKNVSNNEYWSGDVAQVQIYNRALSAAEIQQNYNALKGRYANYVPIIPYWIATLGGALEEQAYSIAVDGSGNLYITGITASSGAGSNDILIAKYNTSGTIQWQRTLGGIGDDRGHNIAVDSSGNVYITGSTASSGAGSNDILIAKYNTSGTIQWQRTLGGTGSEFGQRIAVDGSGNVYVIGETEGSGAGAGGWDVLIAKYDTSGTIQWQRTLGGSNPDFGRGIAVDGGGNIYITGQTNSDVFIAKYDTSGTIQWQRTLGGTSSDIGQGIAVDGSGNVYITGSTASSGAGSNDILIAKYDTSGAIQWQRTLGGASSDFGIYIAVDGSGNVYITGFTQSSGAGSNDVLIAKYNSSGTIQWQRTLGGASTDYGYGIAVDGSGNIYITGTYGAGGNYNVLIAKLPADGSFTGTYGALTYATSSLTAATPTLTAATSSLTAATSSLTSASAALYWIATLSGLSGQGIAVDGSGNVYITGSTNSSGAGGHDVLIAKYDTSGTIQWQRTLGGINADVGRSIAVDGSGNVYITGYTQSLGAGFDDVLIAKYDTSGTIQWQRILGGSNYDQGHGIAVDGSGNVYVTGSNASSFAGDYGVLIAKYDTSGTIQWQRTLNGGSTDQGLDIAVDGSGNIYITGASNNFDALIAKYDTSGTIQWQRTLGGIDADAGFGIAFDGSGNVYVAGRTTSSPGVIQVPFIAKYNSSGGIVWQRTLGDGAGQDIAVDSSGNVYVTYYNGLIVKYNSSGGIVWQRTLSSLSGQGIAVDGSGNFYVTGGSLISKLPGDGSLTGTYGSYTYATSTFTAATSSLTSATSSLSSASSSLTAATSTLTVATSALTSTPTIISGLSTATSTFTSSVIVVG